MTRRPPRSTRTDTLFPYTTLFRALQEVRQGSLMACFRLSRLLGVEDGFTVLQNLGEEPVRFAPCIQHSIVHSVSKDVFDRRRAEERRVGKECVSPCRSGW